jgi:hypothetical protein
MIEHKNTKLCGQRKRQKEKLIPGIPYSLSKPIILFWKSRYKIVEETLPNLVFERQAQPDKYLIISHAGNDRIRVWVIL